MDDIELNGHVTPDRTCTRGNGVKLGITGFGGRP